TTVHLQIKVLIVTCFGVVHQPVGDRCTADVGEFVLSFAEQDAVTNHSANRGNGHILFGHVDLEICHRVDGGVRNQVDRVGTGQEDLVHVVRLVVEHRGVTPGALFVDPVT